MCRLKLSRLFCLLCALSVFFGSFGLSASAASDSDNLVDTNIRNWQLIYDTTVTVTGDYYVLKIPKEDSTDLGIRVVVGGVCELPDFNTGDSFTFSLDLAKPSDISISETYYHNMFNSGNICIGLATYSGSINDFVMVEDCSVLITKDNYSSYLGKHLSINFTMPNIINPCIVISFIGSDTLGQSYLYQGSYIGVKNVSLINNSKAEEDSFFSRLFEWFQEKFDAIGESFTNLGNKLTDLKDGFINKITELKTSFENKISDLKESFQAKIDELKQGLIDLKDNLIEGIKSLFVPDEQFIATWKEELELLLQERLGIIWDAGDFFIALIETIGDLLTTTADDIHYELPEMVIELNGQTYRLWEAQQVDFSFLEKNAFFAMLYKLYKAVLNVFLGIPLLNYAKKEMDATLHN